MLNQTSTEWKQSRDEARQTIIEHSREYFTSDKSGKGYICPVCGSGSGEHGTGVTENPKKPNHFTCWRGCFKNADIFEVIGKEYGLGSFAEQYTKACEIFGISPDDGGQSVQRPTRKADHKGKTDSPTTQPAQDDDFTAFYREAQRHLTETDYHRGISLETLKRFGVGFMPDWKHPKAPSNIQGTPRLIVPNDEGGYLARDTRQNLTGKQQEYVKMRAGKTGLFNAEALKQDKSPIWIVEGEFDALSIIDAGGEAVALCSTTNAGKLIKAVKEQRPKMPLIIALDSDKAGESASTQIAEALKQLNFSLYRKKLPEPYKDANEFLTADRESFTVWISTGADEALRQHEDAEAVESEAFEREAVAYYLPEFAVMLKKNRETPAISTGFSNLDSVLGGGLYAGLYFIGAVSSLGKTTLALQLADQVAQSGHGVLIFSLEMARSELMAKTLSRLSFLKCAELYQSTKYAKTTRGILRGYFSREEGEIMRLCMSEYSEWGKYIHVSEGVGNIGMSEVTAKTEQYIKHVGKPPVILIDYTQILEPPEKGLTDKQAVDKNVVQLKRLSRDYHTPVIGISSFNRDNYSAPVSMAAFKESGSIEYSSDVLIGLQYYGWDFEDMEKGEKDAQRMMRIRMIREDNERKAANFEPQEIQLKVLKNRNGRKGNCRFDFWPAFNFFRENGE